jgi:hypothetical protein
MATPPRCVPAHVPTTILAALDASCGGNQVPRHPPKRSRLNGHRHLDFPTSAKARVASPRPSQRPDLADPQPSETSHSSSTSSGSSSSACRVRDRPHATIGPQGPLTATTHSAVSMPLGPPQGAPKQATSSSCQSPVQRQLAGAKACHSPRGKPHT